MKILKKISRPERRVIQKLGHSALYLSFLQICRWILAPIHKRFFRLPIRAVGVISLASFKLCGYTFGYIDNFIVEKKLRGKGAGKRLFHFAFNQAKKQSCDYVILLSRSGRSASHRFYQKMNMKIIWLPDGSLFAYKKIT